MNCKLECNWSLQLWLLENYTISHLLSLPPFCLHIVALEYVFSFSGMHIKCRFTDGWANTVCMLCNDPSILSSLCVLQWPLNFTTARGIWHCSTYHPYTGNWLTFPSGFCREALKEHSNGKKNLVNTAILLKLTLFTSFLFFYISIYFVSSFHLLRGVLCMFLFTHAQVAVYTMCIPSIYSDVPYHTVHHTL